DALLLMFQSPIITFCEQTENGKNVNSCPPVPLLRCLCLQRPALFQTVVTPVTSHSYSSHLLSLPMEEDISTNVSVVRALGAPEADGGAPSIVPASTGVKSPPWLSSPPPNPLSDTDLGGATTMVPQYKDRYFSDALKPQLRVLLLGILATRSGSSPEQHEKRPEASGSEPPEKVPRAGSLQATEAAEKRELWERVNSFYQASLWLVLHVWRLREEEQDTAVQLLSNTGNEAGDLPYLYRLIGQLASRLASRLASWLAHTTGARVGLGELQIMPQAMSCSR
ncbi:hypothetical protein KUCAC02_026185, partial [Chaenocephalus aceratus]